jgi:hypothetical protein
LTHDPHVRYNTYTSYNKLVAGSSDEREDKRDEDEKGFEKRIRSAITAAQGCHPAAACVFLWRSFRADPTARQAFSHGW